MNTVRTSKRSLDNGDARPVSLKKKKRKYLFILLIQLRNSTYFMH